MLRWMKLIDGSDYGKIKMKLDDYIEYETLKFEVECNHISAKQREQIHIFIRKTLERTNSHLKMKGLWPV
jgi:hypothetical protein